MDDVAVINLWMLENFKPDDTFVPNESELVIDTVRGLDEGTIQLLMGLAIDDAWEDANEEHEN